MNEAPNWVDSLCAIFCYLLYNSRYWHNLLQDTWLHESLYGVPMAPQFSMGPKFHPWHWNNFHQNYSELDVALATQAFKNENYFLFILTETVYENYKPSLIKQRLFHKCK